MAYTTRFVAPLDHLASRGLYQNLVLLFHPTDGMASIDVERFRVGVSDIQVFVLNGFCYGYRELFR